MPLPGPLLSSTTTIEVQRDVAASLRILQRRQMDPNLSATIAKLLEGGGEQDVYVKFITVDGFLADSADHEVIFQLGGGPEQEGPPRYYRFFNGKVEEIAALPRMRVAPE